MSAQMLAAASKEIEATGKRVCRSCLLSGVGVITTCVGVWVGVDVSR